MCGIAGFCSFEEDFLLQKERYKKVLVDMRRSIAHRGNDSTGEYLCKYAGFSHARLSIRDLSLGSQPMIKRIGEVEYSIVYNGEIYNVDEIKPDLISAGYIFETTSDTEVILLAYIHYGLEFVSKLNGIYAFAIWDGAKNQLLMYRDRLGIKPLFYSVKDNVLVFGSEPKALFCHPKIEPEINMDSFREVFGVGPARTPGCGVFKDIFELLPGYFMVFTKQGLREYRYWELETREHTDNYKQTVERVSYLVRDAIIRQMVADVPVCSFLSGGIDSSIVTAVASDYLQDRGATLNTFSFDFRDNETFFSANAFQPERDRPFVDLMKDQYPVNHTYLECDEEMLLRFLYKSVDSKDLPGMADVDASLLYFCSLVSQHNKVALTGECADEIFGGYPWFYREDLMNAKGFPWSSDLSMRTTLLSEEFIGDLRLEEYVKDKYMDSLKAVPDGDGQPSPDAKCREITYLNIKWFMQTLLDRMDRASMYSGLEARVPFADHRIVEYVFNVPWEMKYRKGIAKSLLREACKELLPDGILHRKKSPYPKTYHPNYENLLSQALRKIIQNSNSPILSIIDKKKVETFLKAPSEYGRPWYGQLMAAPQLIAYLIQVNYWLEKFMYNKIRTKNVDK